MKKIASFTILFFLFIVVTSGVYLYNKDVNLHKVPDVALRSIFDKDQILDLKDMQGKAYVVHFFTSYCHSCVNDHLSMAKLSEQVDVYAIASYDNQEKVGEFLDKHGNPYKFVAHDSNGAVAKKFKVNGVPETLLIDKTGEISINIKGELHNQHRKYIIENIDR